jgi:hypothetical protein
VPEGAEYGRIDSKHLRQKAADQLSNSNTAGDESAEGDEP